MNAKGSSGGLKGSKGSAYEGGIRVPAFMMWEGKFKNESSNQFFFIQDVLPTLLSAAEIDYEKVFLKVPVDGILCLNEQLINHKIQF